MLYFGRRRVTVYVVFYGSVMGGFWTLWTQPAWRHCLLLLSIYYPKPGAFAIRYTAKLEPAAWGVDLDVIWRKPEDVAAEYYQAGVTAIVKTSADLPPARIFAMRGVITCVSVIKAVLGIRNWRVIVPKQLFLYLLRNGGELVTWETDDGNAVREKAGYGTGRGDSAGAAGTGAAPTGAGGA